MKLLKKPVVIVILGLVLGGVGFFFWKQKENPQVSYTEVSLRKEDLNISVLATGTVQPKNRLEIKAPVAGRIEQILVKEGQNLRKGQILAWMSSTERAAMLDAARAQGPEEYKKWSELYLATPVMAPISGTLILKNVEPGQTFTSTDAIFVMSDHLTVKAQVDETDIAQIKIKSNAEIALDAYPANILKAHVDQIAFDATTVNNVTTYIVDVIPEKTPEFMRSGMTANVTFYVQEKNQVLVVPNEALKISNGRTTVLLKTPGSREGVPVEIRTGISDGKNTEVLDGLKEGDIVLVAQFKLGSGSTNSGSSPFGMPKMPRRR
ncbi:MAG: macrolide transporter [Bdellovibrio sp. ArHS]|nr:MAG: macrolide transporter [Bdellovibrio sp. ArHS]